MSRTMDWVSLHTHSTYSYMDGYAQPAAHVARVTDLGMDAIALTEHGNVSSHVRLEKAAAAAGGGFRPIYGAELYTGPTDAERRSKWKWHLGALAMNAEGYRNLMRIVTESWEEGFYYEPTVSGESLAEFSDGIAVLSGCTGSKLACDLIGGKGTELHAPDFRNATRTAWQFLQLLGDRYYLEVQAFPDLDKTCAINPAYEQLGNSLGIPLLATCDVHYPFPKDNKMQVILHAAGRGSKSFEQQTASWEYDVKLTYPKSDDQLCKRLIRTGLSPRAARSAIENAATLAERCTGVTLPKAERLVFPRIKGQRNLPSIDLLRQWVGKGWVYRGCSGLGKNIQREYEDRIEREMALVDDKGFADFFLATADVIQWAKDSGISVGPARGSAAASLVCYLLRITEVNPMRYPMMMLERFIDPSRPDPPDIDLDFDDERRDEIRGYLAGKYGHDNVGNIGNFIRYRAKNSINDVARVYSVPRSATSVINDVVTHRSDGDTRLNDTLSDTFASFPSAAAVLERYPKLKMAMRLEGNMRGMSVHAAGLVVSTEPIPDICAMYSKKSGTGQNARMLRVLSADKYDAEYLGMLKMDFLGLTTMGMISHALDLAGLNLEDLYGIGDADKKVMKAFRRNDVIGIFQFEGRATRLVNREVKPETLIDLVDINALSRPGPLFSGTTSEYVKVRRGYAEAESLHPELDKLTLQTKGQIIFQEQIIAVVRQIGGFDWTDANSVRRVIAKKLGEAAFNVNFGKFAEGAERLHGIDKDLALVIWKKIVTAGTYAFNIAHSVSYSLLAWWCMWLKVHYPAEFYTASLMKADSPEVIVRLLRDAGKHGIGYLPPDVDHSGETWRLEYTSPRKHDGAIFPVLRAGFSQIPGVGEVTARDIVLERARQDKDVPGKWGGAYEDPWGSLLDVKGIGPVTLGKITSWAESPDPFGVDRAERVVGEIKAAIRAGDLLCPVPTHTSQELQEVSWIGGTERGGARQLKGRRIVWAGLIREREYKDLIEDQGARTGEENEDIIARIKHPELVKFCTLRCYDSGEDEVYLRINRWKFPKFKAMIDDINVGSDAVVAVGRETKGFGAAIQVDELYIIEQDDGDQA